MVSACRKTKNISVRHGASVAYGLCVEDAVRLMQSLQPTPLRQADVGHSDGMCVSCTGQAAQRLADLAQILQFEIARAFAQKKCSTLKDGIYHLRKRSSIASTTLKKLSQLNDAASMLRHFLRPGVNLWWMRFGICLMS